MTVAGGTKCEQVGGRKKKSPLARYFLFSCTQKDTLEWALLRIMPLYSRGNKQPPLEKDPQFEFPDGGVQRLPLRFLQTCPCRQWRTSESTGSRASSRARSNAQGPSHCPCGGRLVVYSGQRSIFTFLDDEGTEMSTLADLPVAASSSTTVTDSNAPYAIVFVYPHQQACRQLQNPRDRALPVHVRRHIRQCAQLGMTVAQIQLHLNSQLEGEREQFGIRNRLVRYQDVYPIHREVATTTRHHNQDGLSTDAGMRLAFEQGRVLGPFCSYHGTGGHGSCTTLDEPWQRELAVRCDKDHFILSGVFRHGKHILDDVFEGPGSVDAVCLHMDATHGTNRYDTRLLIASVVLSNGSDVPVAFAFGNHEDTLTWEALLLSLKAAIPSVAECATFLVMSDMNNAPYCAVRKVFGGAEAVHMWCYFHIKEKWSNKVEELKRAPDGVSPVEFTTNKVELKTLLNMILPKRPQHEFIPLPWAPKDCRISSLEELEQEVERAKAETVAGIERLRTFCQQHTYFRYFWDYFESAYLPYREKWEPCFRILYRFKYGLPTYPTTNNPAEHKNKYLKHGILRRHGSLRLDQALELILTNFAEHYYHEYRLSLEGRDDIKRPLRQDNLPVSLSFSHVQHVRARRRYEFVSLDGGSHPIVCGLAAGFVDDGALALKAAANAQDAEVARLALFESKLAERQAATGEESSRRATEWIAPLLEELERWDDVVGGTSLSDASHAADMRNLQRQANQFRETVRASRIALEQAACGASSTTLPAGERAHKTNHRMSPQRKKTKKAGKAKRTLIPEDGEEERYIKLPKTRQEKSCERRFGRKRGKTPDSEYAMQLGARLDAQAQGPLAL